MTRVTTVTTTLRDMIRSMSAIAPDLRAGFRQQAAAKPWTMENADLVVAAVDVLEGRS